MREVEVLQPWDLGLLARVGGGDLVSLKYGLTSRHRRRF